MVGKGMDERFIPHLDLWLSKGLFMLAELGVVLVAFVVSTLVPSTLLLIADDVSVLLLLLLAVIVCGVSILLLLFG